MSLRILISYSNEEISSSRRMSVVCGLVGLNTLHFHAAHLCHLGSLNSEGLDPALPVPKHLLFTPGGRVTIVSECDEDKTMQFQKIQHNLGAALKQDHWDILAYASFIPLFLYCVFLIGAYFRWRAPHTKVKTDEPPQASGFIDGDLLSRFLELDPSSPLVRRVLEGTKTAERLDLTYTELKHLIEELTAVH